MLRKTELIAAGNTHEYWTDYTAFFFKGRNDDDI